MARGRDNGTFQVLPSSALEQSAVQLGTVPGQQHGYQTRLRVSQASECGHCLSTEIQCSPLLVLQSGGVMTSRGVLTRCDDVTWYFDSRSDLVTWFCNPSRCVVRISRRVLICLGLQGSYYKLADL